VEAIEGSSQAIIKKAMVQKHKIAEIPKMSEKVGAYRF
jgi:hypothetical protein